MKTDQEAGEVRAAHLLAPYLSIHPMGRKGFLKGAPEPVDYKMARKALAFCREVIEKKGHDVVILDEINVAVHYGLITVHDALALMDLKPDTLELVLTGRDAPPEVIKRADLVTEMVAVKHYFDKGIPSRKGIET
jgi:cob(I)alamin adenosyltransferase